MQDYRVRAFRQRLIRSGFKDVHIDCYSGCAIVTCLSPCGEKIHRVFEFNDLPFLPVVKYLI